MKLTAVGSGFYVVSVNGADVSNHLSEREAVESAVNREDAMPSDVVQYRHDYVVRVEAAVPPAAAGTAALSGIESGLNPDG